MLTVDDFVGLVVLVVVPEVDSIVDGLDEDEAIDEVVVLIFVTEVSVIVEITGMVDFSVLDSLVELFVVIVDTLD